MRSNGIFHHSNNPSWISSLISASVLFTAVVRLTMEFQKPVRATNVSVYFYFWLFYAYFKLKQAVLLKMYGIQYTSLVIIVYFRLKINYHFGATTYLSVDLLKLPMSATPEWKFLKCMSLFSFFGER